VISSAYRLAFTAVFKLASKELAAKKISCINIAPGLINTDRLRDLGNADDLAKSLPMKRLGEPKEIGNFIKSIVENKIKYLSGVTINFDGANSSFVL
jgi:3-oxoacyl-[acyl-carrier protein] reductase